MKTQRAVGFALTMSALLVCGHARAYCTVGGSGIPSYTTYRVIVHAGLAAQMLHVDGSPWTAGELDRTVWHAVSLINETANANIPFLYFDNTGDSTCDWSTDCGSSCWVEDTVLLLPTSCSATGAIGGPLPGSGAIYIPSSFTSVLRYEHGIFVPSGDNFEHVIQHEMGHAFGMGHPDGSWGGVVCVPAIPGTSVCPAGAQNCPVMLGDRGVGYSGLGYGPDDVNGLQSLWGRRTAPSLNVYEKGAISNPSPPFYDWPTDDVGDIAGYLAASSSPWTSPFIATVVALRRTNNGHITVFGWDWNNGSVPWSVALSPGGALNGRVGVAETPTHRVVAAHRTRADGTARLYRRRLFEARSSVTASGTGWTSSTTNPIPAALDDTLTGGVASAYDSTSGAVVHAMRDDGGQVVLVGRTSMWSNPVPTGVLSYVSPAIACASSVCMLAVVEPMRGAAPGATSVATRLQWVEFSWNQTGSTATWTPGTLRTSSWSMTGAISAGVVFRWPSGEDFYVTSAFIQTGGTFGANWGTRLFAYRHEPGSTTMSLMLPAVTEVANEFLFASAGGVSNYAEAFVIVAP